MDRLMARKDQVRTRKIDLGGGVTMFVMTRPEKGHTPARGPERKAPAQKPALSADRAHS